MMRMRDSVCSVCIMLCLCCCCARLYAGVCEYDDDVLLSVAMLHDDSSVRCVAVCGRDDEGSECMM